MNELSPCLSRKPVLEALGLSRASFYRHRRVKEAAAKEKVSKFVPRALKVEERAEVLNVLSQERFVDASPGAVYATLLDEGRYLCSERTMYRILKANAMVRERRDICRHPSYQRPELMAHRPNELWSWDITKLRGPHKGTWYHLYVILDVYSRYVVGWMVAEKESEDLAKLLMKATMTRQGIQPDCLTLHSDRGPAMKSAGVAELLVTLGVTKSHSRPSVSDDNPYSESQFKTMKYRGDYPDRFGSLEDARGWCQGFFEWYNRMHKHSGIAMLTPETVHHGHAERILAARQDALTRAYAAHRERFVNRAPVPRPLPAAVWINPPRSQNAAPTNPTSLGPQEVHC